MLAKILELMWVEPEVLEALSEEQKRILFSKMREEQVRRWTEREGRGETEDHHDNHDHGGPKKASTKHVTWLLGRDGDVRVSVIGEEDEFRSSKLLQSLLNNRYHDACMVDVQPAASFPPRVTDLQGRRPGTARALAKRVHYQRSSLNTGPLTSVHNQRSTTQRILSLPAVHYQRPLTSVLSLTPEPGWGPEQREEERADAGAPEEDSDCECPPLPALRLPRSATGPLSARPARKHMATAAHRCGRSL
ncbi:unnamed protein product [Boreogadus saida]